MTDTPPTTDRDPIVLAFCCHFCAYAAADLAGSMRLQYPPNVRVLRLPCTGKLEVNYLLAAFERGADGVMVAGCLEGQCHFLEGNLRARRRVERAKQLLGEIGLEPERLEMFNLSSAEGPRFAQIATEMSERLARLGPSPLRGTSAPGAADFADLSVPPDPSEPFDHPHA
ncbi:MAG: hydrogenase iron-sulfur subunit [Armatimonadetes bacterium CG_4_10_14_3_um_filter_66_18]|nr:hydrogenase iron-sulfur subunit [Armatimonadota bacterium]NCO90166.1 hydrogenase iron-sulfur subunit [Armatimonadota bacterium]PIY50375.1 MAG: hydrogenase iron-sulfur subunit [Armatimonadetes bacterium CG_4_10_14_3_um_filter_66_18]